MSKLRDRLPQRLVSPLHGVEAYLDRRMGAPDPTREARRQRALGRLPLPTTPAAIQQVSSTAGVDVLRTTNLYRTPAGGGQPERIKAQRRNASGTPEVVTLATTADIVSVQTTSAITTWDPPSLSPGSSANLSVTVSGVANDQTWVCVASLDTLPASWLISANPDGSNSVRVTIYNVSGSTVNLSLSAVAVRCWKAT